MISASVDERAMATWRLLWNANAAPARRMAKPVVEWPTAQSESQYACILEALADASPSKRTDRSDEWARYSSVRFASDSIVGVGQVSTLESLEMA